MSLIESISFTLAAGNDRAAWLPLLDAVLKSTILLAFAWSVSRALRRRSAAIRHATWALALAGAAALPIVSLAVPKWQLPLVQVAAVTPHWSATLPAAPPAEAPRMSRQAAPACEHPHVDCTDLRVEGGASPAGWLTGATGPAWSSIQWLFALWLAGVVVCLGRLALSLVAVRWLTHGARSADEAPWLAEAGRLAEKLGIRRRVEYRLGRHASMPLASGLLRPTVVMPVAAEEWPAERLRVVLLHELAHVKRRDCLTHALAQVACAFHWFNPLAWVALRQMRAERERACDDLVLAAGTCPPDYASELIEIARSMRPDRELLLGGAALAMARRSQLEGRLMAILDPDVPRAGLSRVRLSAAAAALFVVLVSLAAIQPWTVKAQEKADAHQLAALASSPIQGVAPTPAPQPGPAPRPEPRSAEPGAQIDAARIAGDAAQSMRAAGLVDSVVASVDVAIDNIAATVADAVAEAFAQGEAKRTTRREVDPRAVEALITALSDADRGVRESAMHALVRVRHPSMFDPLVRALGDESADIRETAAFALGQLRDRRAVAPLTAALKDASPGVREQAVFALGQFRDAGAVDAVVAVLNDPAKNVREQAAFALGQFRDPRAVDPLILALKDASPSVREQAAFALGQLRDRRAVDALVAALRDERANVREQVAFALGQLRDPRAIDALTEALKDASADVRQQAAFALGQIVR